MAPSIVAVLTIGGLLGLRHAFEPDHLAAVSTLATRPGGRRLWSAGRLGVIWGLGHTVTVGAVALLIIALGVRLPAGLWPAAELLVAGLLILLGTLVIWRYVRGRWHMHAHVHAAAAPHFHLHSHAADPSRAHARGGRRAAIARLRHCARTRGEWRHCRAARRGRSRYDVAARLLRGVQRGNDRRDARRVAHSVGGRPVCRRMGRALGDDSPRGSR